MSKEHQLIRLSITRLIAEMTEVKRSSRGGQMTSGVKNKMNQPVIECRRAQFVWSVLSALVLLLAALPCGETVNLNRYHKLRKDEFIKLDWEVNDYFEESYAQSDTKNITYEEQLYRSIRALRHTIVLNQFDYRYTNELVMRRAAGAKVDWQLCDMQLDALLQMARARTQQEHSVPLSAINLLESSGRTESGVLNGNSIWWGSPASCKRASISADSIRRFFSAKGELDGNQELFRQPIQARQCIAHLRAKSWPEFDIYFEDRIAIRVGLCVPDSCHSAQFFGSNKTRDNIDELTRANLAFPFNSDRFEVFYLYCLPDEDSEFRRWDLGTRMFVACASVWLALLFWCNWKYYQRSIAMKKIRDAIDIKMIINQRRESDESSDKDDTQSHPQRRTQIRRDVGNHDDSEPSSESKTLGTVDVVTKDPSLLAPGFSATPQPSDTEENDGEFSSIRPLVTDKADSSRSRQRVPPSNSPPRGIDFIRAFSIESNLAYLLKTRRNEAKARDDYSRGRSSSSCRKSSSHRTTSQQVTVVNRRTSSSNEALIKNLKQQEQQHGDPNKPKVAILDNSFRDEQEEQQPVNRVNIDIFDGIKVLATSWIIYGHTLMFFFGLVSDLRFGDERMLDFVMVATINTLQVVGLFYVITGALLTYLAFSRQNLKQLMRPSFWLLVVFGRYIRLIPTYLLIFWFARHVSPFSGSGIYWFDYRTDSENARGFCATQTWWTMLTMSAADVKIPLDCLPQSWYLSNDFRTLMILPIYVVILARNQLAGYGAILSTFVYSVIRLVNILRGANIDYKVLIRWNPHVYSLMADRLHDVYTDLAVRLNTYLLGVVVGHILYLYETRQLKTLPWWLRKYGMKFALSVACIFFMGAPLISKLHFLLPSPDSVSSDTIVILIPLFKSAMELSISVVLLLLATGNGNRWISALLTSRYAKILSNISYGVFLVHVEVMYKIPAFKFESSYWYLFTYSTFFVVASNAIAFLVHVLYEMPVNNLLRYLTNRMFKNLK